MLSLSELCHEHDSTIWKFKRVVMRIRPLWVDLTEARHSLPNVLRVEEALFRLDGRWVVSTGEFSARSATYAASVVTPAGSTIDGSSFSGLLTRVEIGHMRIGPAGNGRINSRGSASSLNHRT